MTPPRFSQILLPHRNLIAYFSMEIGFRNEIPTYSGGLGILAGDTLKAIADLGVDAVAVTLLSKKGYFYQRFDEHNYQQEEDYKWNVPSLLKKLDAKIRVPMLGREVILEAWEYELEGIRGQKIKIIFLDSSSKENIEEDRTLTSHLYGGDITYRLRQEILLGIGGIKMLRALNYNPRIYHMNEGHAAFLIIELFHELADLDNDKERQETIRQLCSFTTHTPVPAGHDAFDKTAIMDHFREYLPAIMMDQAGEYDKFSMTRLALSYSAYVNAVARKHQEVSKKMFPEFSIDYITNGVHSLTWTNTHFAALFDKHIIDWRVNPLELRNAFKIPIREVWRAHERAKQELIDYINTTLNAGLEYDVFTIGFARRATAYKRAELLFRDIPRLKEIARRVGRIQLVFAGKAHPRDTHGKEIIQRIKGHIAELAPSIKLVFLENYNMYIAGLMTSGVDVWLNTPKRPLEASGTSGMKAAHNGVPSLSVPDGWWIEGLIENVTGWGIGPEVVSGIDDFAIDENDANDLYQKLEQKILPLYYNNKEGYSILMRNVIAINASYFNTHRMTKQYIVRAYARNN